MDEFINSLLQLDDTLAVFKVSDIVIVLVLSCTLSIIIGYLYRATYRGSGYTQSYVQTMVLMSVVVSMIMLIIGSNIARAFSLVGALSIVRFRNAIKDSRDVGYIFFALAVGMACGTKFYFLAIVSTIVLGGLLWLMNRVDMFSGDTGSRILKVRVPQEAPYDRLFSDTFARYLSTHKMIAVENTQNGTMNELVYEVRLRRRTNSQEFIQELQRLNGNNKVLLIIGFNEMSL